MATSMLVASAVLANAANTVKASKAWEIRFVFM
jgi:hypothetical protein